MEPSSPLGHEWATLQQDHERHERTAAGIKIAAVVVTAAGFVAVPEWASVLLLGALWIQEAMLRTVQGRLGDRLLLVEALLAKTPAPAGEAYRFHTAWNAQRGGVVSLLVEYLRSAFRPTVLFPYPVLMAIVAVSGL
jgi:hypothetical protein